MNSGSQCAAIQLRNVDSQGINKEKAAGSKWAA